MNADYGRKSALFSISVDLRLSAAKMFLAFFKPVFGL
jgi:hypothetical protein